MNQDHPYKKLERTQTWKTIEKAIADLIDNGDITEATARRYIVGYLTEQILKQRLTSARLQRVRKKIQQTRDVSQDLENVMVELDGLVASKSSGR